ncbi:Cyclic di-GMP phosphodiesterase YahA [compost metagenome]
MIDMARAKGLKITAEGVETTEQQSVLKSLGCDSLQGFLLSRPMPRPAVVALMLKIRQESSDAIAVLPSS